MSGSTTELALSTAVDTDDNADYLTLSLANSLRTVDALFNSITGHNHGGAHQGGAIAAAAIPGGSITNAMLGADVARANQLVNGGLEIWQRGSGPFTVAGLQMADRWQLNTAGTDTFSLTKDTTHVDTGSLACAAIAFTLGTGAGVTFFGQGLQPGDAAGQLRGRTVSLSVRVRTSTANAVRARVYGDGTGNTPVLSGYHSGGGAYETLTVTYIVPADATVLVATVVFSASCTAYIDNANLVVGSQAANYVPMHPADDLARCLRYYEVHGHYMAFGGYSTAAGNIYQGFPYRAYKAVTPTVTKVGTWTAANCAQPSVPAFGTYSFSLTTAAVGTGSLVAATIDASTYVSSEANP